MILCERLSYFPPSHPLSPWHDLAESIAQCTTCLPHQHPGLLKASHIVPHTPLIFTQVTTLNLWLNERCGSMAGQLQCAFPAGANISRVRIAGNKENEATGIENELPKFQDQPRNFIHYSHPLKASTMQALSQEIARSMPWMRQSITEVELGVSVAGFCSILAFLCADNVAWAFKTRCVVWALSFFVSLLGNQAAASAPPAESNKLIAIV